MKSERQKERNKSYFTLYIILIFEFSCSPKISYDTFLNKKKHGTVIVDMSNTITGTRQAIVIDSLSIVNNVINKIINNNNDLKIVVYYNGNTHSGFKSANYVAHKIKDKLIENGFSESKISCDVKFYVPKIETNRYVFKKIDFIVY